jgi:hypothetical protein
MKVTIPHQGNRLMTISESYLAVIRSHSIATILLLVLSLTGCLGIPSQQVKIPDYSLGPISSDEFPALLHDAIPASEGKVHVFGKVRWSGFRDSRNYPVISRHFHSVAAITDTDILLLNWYDPEKRYRIVKRLRYSEILSVSKLGSAIYLYSNDETLSLGDKNYVTYDVLYGKTNLKTILEFTKSYGLLSDQEKSEAAFTILKDHIKLHESTRPTSDTSFEDDY